MIHLIHQLKNSLRVVGFFFPDTFEPTTDTGAFHNQHTFATAMLKGTTSTLLFHGGNYASTQDAQIEDVFPVVFPFGKGEVQGPRENGVSPLECFKHYMHLSLPQTKGLISFLLCAQCTIVSNYSIEAS